MECYSNTVILKQIRDNGSILRRKELEDILTHNKIEKPQRKKLINSENELGSFLNTTVQTETLLFPHRKYKLYLIGDRQDYELKEIALSVNENAYLSHSSALRIHGLPANKDRTIYVNVEQAKKRKDILLNQEAINNAMKEPVKLSNNSTNFKYKKIVLLNGQHTDNLGVNLNNKFPATDIERTLIDIAVRPQYAGGIQEVLNVYKATKNLICINKLVSYLKTINFIYPYHQSIGFLLQAAGYKKSEIDLLKTLPLKYDFYLVHKMDEMNYSKTWRLFYPSNFKQNN